MINTCLGLTRNLFVLRQQATIEYAQLDFPALEYQNTSGHKDYFSV